MILTRTKFSRQRQSFKKILPVKCHTNIAGERDDVLRGQTGRQAARQTDRQRQTGRQIHMVKHMGAFSNSEKAPETFNGNVLTSSYTQQNFPFSNLSLVTAYTQNCFLSLSNA